MNGPLVICFGRRPDGKIGFEVWWRHAALLIVGFGGVVYTYGRAWRYPRG